LSAKKTDNQGLQLHDDSSSSSQNKFNWATTSAAMQSAVVTDVMLHPWTTAARSFLWHHMNISC